MRNCIVILTATALAAAPAAAQIGLPQLGGTVENVLGVPQQTLEPLTQTADRVVKNATQLARDRVTRLMEFVRTNRDTVELDDRGEPARKGELLLVDPADADLTAAQGAGFAVLGRETLGELGVSVARLGVPDRMSLARGEAALRKLLPQATITADNLHQQSGGKVSSSRSPASADPPAIDTQVGLIDSGPGPAIQAGTLRGFAAGAPHPSDHGSATASLLRIAGVRRVAIADVYGTDRAGGNALAISRAIDWLLGSGVRVISISLVGPSNSLLEKAIAAAQRRGVVFIAAVGNDGLAAPPAYPASYPGVIAVTGVDGRNRALIEAGRARHLDYAAPGADMVAMNTAGRWMRVRGTSYAAPLVAARVAAVYSAGTSVRPALDREAVDLGSKGPDATYGRGLLCGSCRRSR